MKIDTNIALLKYRRTKIIATIGPKSSSPEIIENFIDTGVNVFRLNMSHGTHDGHRECYGNIRSCAKKKGKTVAIIADLSGPKIRVGKFAGGKIVLEKGERVTVTTRDIEGEPGLIPSQYTALADDVEPGSVILLDDGNIQLQVETVDGTEIECRVISGGPLSDRKGMNLPGVNVSAPSMTEKDIGDAKFSIELGVDFLALSFVRHETDIIMLRDLITKAGSDVSIIAKIEKPEALENIEAILDETDAIMVARGDLGVELSPELVPTAQDQLIKMAQEYRKPVIIATQMLESMIKNSRPTRAEVSDVANAVRFGVDAIMLSGETAVGDYPVQAIQMMDHIARQTEGNLWKQGAFGGLSKHEHMKPPIRVEDAVAESTAQLSRDLLVRAIVVLSRKGRSIAVVSSSKPAAPIIGLTPDIKASRRENLLWGVVPVTIDEEDMETPRILGKKIVEQFGLVSESQSFLIVQGFSSDPEKNFPSVTVVQV